MGEGVGSKNGENDALKGEVERLKKDMDRLVKTLNEEKKNIEDTYIEKLVICVVIL